MTELWMPGAKVHSLGNTGAMNGGPSRAVWHITSNDNDHTFANELGWFTGGGADVAPHLLWDPFSGEIAQMFPADSRSLSLQNAGDVRTNRTGAHCIQIETVFTAGENVAGHVYNTVAETPCKGLGDIMAWLRSLGIPDVWPAGPPTGFHRQDVSVDFWLNHGGHYGHCHVPGNSHVDPGPMPSDMLSLGGHSAPPPPPPAHGPTAHPRYPYPVGIHPGGTSPSARPLQRALKATGWMPKNTPESDHYGPLTENGVAGFNRKHGFNSHGVSWDTAIGPRGWALLMTLAYGRD